MIIFIIGIIIGAVATIDLISICFIIAEEKERKKTLR